MPPSVVTMLEAMGRLPRTIGDGLVYYAFNQGNDRADVFGDDADCLAFLDALAKVCERYPFRLFDYYLMNFTSNCSFVRNPDSRSAGS
jgi:hypothetical protein